MKLIQPQNDHTYSGIQAMRFVAALLVVVTHATGMVSERILGLSAEEFWRPGMAGVDIFFVISGFVMAMSSRKLVGKPGAWKTFMHLRLIRIVPMYWLATTLKIMLVLAVPSMALNTVLDLRLVLTSYFFIPQFTATYSLALPVLKVGWTLTYEMFFYIVFALALFLRRPALSTTAVVFVTLSIINFVAPREWALFHGFLGPLLLEFVMGMLIAEIAFRGYKMNAWLGVALVGAAFAVIVMSGNLPIEGRWLFWGVPAMVIVGVAALTEQSIRKWLPKILAVLGDSSYSLYLFHTFTVPLLGVVFVKLHFHNTVLAVVLCVLISPLISLVIYKVLEQPLTRFIKSATVRLPSVQVRDGV